MLFTPMGVLGFAKDNIFLLDRVFGCCYVGFGSWVLCRRLFVMVGVEYHLDLREIYWKRKGEWWKGTLLWLFFHSSWSSCFLHYAWFQLTWKVCFDIHILALILLVFFFCFDLCFLISGYGFFFFFLIFFGKLRRKKKRLRFLCW